MSKARKGQAPPAPPTWQPGPDTSYFLDTAGTGIHYAARRLNSRADWLQLPAGALVLVAAVRPPLMPPVTLEGFYYGGAVVGNELRAGGPLWLRPHAPETWHPGWPLTALREVWVLETREAEAGGPFIPLLSL